MPLQIIKGPNASLAAAGVRKKLKIKLN